MPLQLPLAVPACPGELTVPTTSKCKAVSSNGFKSIHSLAVTHDATGKRTLYFLANETDLLELTVGNSEAITLKSFPTWGPDGRTGNPRYFAAGGPMVATADQVFFSISFEPEFSELGYALDGFPNTPGGVWALSLADKAITRISGDEPYVGGLAVSRDQKTVYWSRSYPGHSHLCSIQEATHSLDGNWHGGTFTSNYYGACPEAGRVAVTDTGLFWTTSGTRPLDDSGHPRAVPTNAGAIFSKPTYWNAAVAPEPLGLATDLQHPLNMIAVGNAIVYSTGNGDLWRYEDGSGAVSISKHRFTGDTIGGMASDGTSVFMSRPGKLIKQPISGGCGEALLADVGNLGPVAVDEKFVYVVATAPDGQEKIMECSR